MNINYENKEPIIIPFWRNYFLDIAKVIATRSPDSQTKVGAIIVDSNNRIISTGYNGFLPHLVDGSLPNLRPDKYLFIVHAEINAIISAKKDLINHRIYITHSPCIDCTKAIITSGISQVFFETKYDNYEFVKDLLLMSKVNIEQIFR